MNNLFRKTLSEQDKNSQRILVVTVTESFLSRIFNFSPSWRLHEISNAIGTGHMTALGEKSDFAGLQSRRKKRCVELS